jgi:hypothetical protein
MTTSELAWIPHEAGDRWCAVVHHGPPLTIALDVRRVRRYTSPLTGPTGRRLEAVEFRVCALFDWPCGSEALVDLTHEVLPSQPLTCSRMLAVAREAAAAEWREIRRSELNALLTLTRRPAMSVGEIRAWRDRELDRRRRKNRR